MTVLLAGCAMKSGEPAPVAPIAMRWIDAPATSAAAPAADWWSGFNAPALSRLMEQMQADNLDLAAAAARVRQADATSRIAGAPLLPSVSAGISSSRSREPSGRSLTNRASYTNDYSATLSASYELDFWGKNAAARQSAQASAQAARYDVGVVALTAQASLAQTYFDYLAALDHLAVARENLRAALDVRDAFRDQVTLGVATSVDLAQQETVVAQARAAIPPLEQEARQDRTAIALLVGVTPDKLDLGSGTLDGLRVPVNPPGLPSELLARRPDVRQAEFNLAAADANIAAARAAFLPSITLTGQGGFESAALDTLFKPGSLLLTAAASAAQPIFNGGQLTGQLELNRARYDELLADYKKAALSAFADVENALIAVQKTEEEDRAQDAAVATARDAYQQVQDQLKGGVAKITDVLNTERTLFQAEDAQLQARQNRLDASVSLMKALGGGWQESTQ